MRGKFLRKCLPYIFLAPTFITLVIFLYLSVGVAFGISLTDKMASPAFETHFIGLENFQTLLSDKVFWLSFRNQVLISIFAVFNSCFFPLLAALLLFYVRHRRRAGAVRIAFVLPMLVPSIVTILIWKFLYNPNFGFNSILRLFDLGNLAHNWLNDGDTALWSVVLLGFPFVSGMYFLLFHAGLNNIDNALYDAAKVDGATSWTIIRHIQLPGVWPYVKVVATLSLIASLSGFGQVSALTGGGPGYETMIPALYMYKVAFGDGRQGYSSALGVVLFIVILILTVVTNKLMSIKEEKKA